MKSLTFETTQSIPRFLRGDRAVGAARGEGRVYRSKGPRSVPSRRGSAAPNKGISFRPAAYSRVGAWVAIWQVRTCEHVLGIYADAAIRQSIVGLELSVDTVRMPYGGPESFRRINSYCWARYLSVCGGDLSTFTSMSIATWTIRRLLWSCGAASTDCWWFRRRESSRWWFLQRTRNGTNCTV